MSLKILNSIDKLAMSDLVADCGSIVRAAERLGIPESTVDGIMSGQINQLEDIWEKLDPIMTPYIEKRGGECGALIEFSD